MVVEQKSKTTSVFYKRGIRIGTGDSLKSSSQVQACKEMVLITHITFSTEEKCDVRYSLRVFEWDKL